MHLQTTINIGANKIDVWAETGRLLDYSNDTSTHTSVTNNNYRVLPGGVVSGGPTVNTYTRHLASVWMHNDHRDEEQKVLINENFSGRPGHEVARIYAGRHSDKTGSMYAFVNLTAKDTYFTLMDLAPKRLFPRTRKQQIFRLIYWCNLPLFLILIITSAQTPSIPFPLSFLGFVSSWIFLIGTVYGIIQWNTRRSLVAEFKANLEGFIDILSGEMKKQRKEIK